MRLERLRALARYNILSSIAVLSAAAAAQPALAATIIVNAPDGDGVVIPDGDSLVNNSDISNSGYAVESLGSVGTVTNATGASITSSGNDGVHIIGTVTTFTNEVGADIWGGGHGIFFAGTVGTFSNAGTIHGDSETAISFESVGSFVNSGTIEGPGGVSFGGAVTSFRNEADGVIEGTSSFGVSAYNWVGDFYNAGLITGTTGAYFDTDVDAFTNAGTITGPLGVDLRGAVDSFRNEAGGLIEGTDEKAVRFSGPVGDFYNAGTILGGSENAILFESGATVDSFANAGTIGGVTFDDAVGSFRNDAGAMIEGANDSGVNFNASVDNFYNAGAITGSWFGVYVQNGMLGGTNAAGGTISSPNGAALYFDSVADVDFENAGTISGDTGIQVQAVQPGSSRVVNAGTIEGTGGLAVDFDHGGGQSRDDRLTLLTGSKILGGIAFGQGNDTLDFSGFTGNTLLDVASLEAVEAGTVNYVWDQPNEQIAIFDLTGPSGIGNGLSDVAGAVNGVIGGQLGQGQGGGAPLAYAPAPRQSAAAAAAETAVLSELDVGAGGSAAWAAVFGGGSSDDAPVSVSNLFGGVVAGAHTRIGGGELGLLGGYAQGNYDVLAGQETVATDTGLLGLYGRTGLGIVDVSYALLGGLNAHQGTREVVAMGVTQTASASYTSWFVAPSLKAQIPVLSGEEGDLSVVGAATYVGGSVVGYTETGSSMNLTVGSQAIGNFDGRIGLAGRIGSAGVSLTAGGGVFALANIGSSSVPVTVLGQTVDAVTPGSTGYGAYAGVGLDAALAGNATLSLGLDGSLRTDGVASGAARAKLEGSF